MNSMEEYDLYGKGYDAGYQHAVAEIREILAKHELQYKLNLNKEKNHE